MSDATAEILRELRAIRCMQQATLHALYSFGGITPNPVPLVAFPVLPAATPDAERHMYGNVGSVECECNKALSVDKGRAGA